MYLGWYEEPPFLGIYLNIHEALLGYFMRVHWHQMENHGIVQALTNRHGDFSSRKDGDLTYYHLVSVYTLLLSIAINIVDLPINMGIFRS